MLIPQELQLSQKELMSVAAKIADNLTFADDVSDEDVKHKPILAEYIETESGKKSNSLQLLAALAMYRKTNSILIVAKCLKDVGFRLHKSRGYLSEQG